MRSTVSTRPSRTSSAATSRTSRQFDLGTSIRTNQPVRAELTERLPATLELGLTALLIAVILGVGLGVTAAVYRYRLGDRFVQLFVVLSSATAVFWIALIAISLLVNKWGIFNSPTGRLPRGFDPPPDVTGFYTVDALLAGDLATAGAALRTLLLPALLLGVLASPSIVKIVRSATIRALESDFARTSRSFGYSSRSILFQDGLRNSLLPVITNVGLVAGFVLAGGDVIIEQLFAWPGIGSYAYQSLAGERPVRAPGIRDLHRYRLRADQHVTRVHLRLGRPPREPGGGWLSMAAVNTTTVLRGNVAARLRIGNPTAAIAFGLLGTDSRARHRRAVGLRQR